MMYSGLGMKGNNPPQRRLRKVRRGVIFPEPIEIKVTERINQNPNQSELNVIERTNQNPIIVIEDADAAPSISEVSPGHDSSKEHKASKEKVTPMTLLERIPIVGIENLSHATTKAEGYFWIAIILLSLVATFYYLIPSITIFIEHGIIIDYQRVGATHPLVPFPNVIVCLDDNVNMTRFGEQILGKPMFKDLLNSSRLRLLGDRYGSVLQLSRETIAYSYSKPWELDWVEEQPMGAQVFNEIFNRIHETFGSDWKGYGFYHLDSLYPCKAVLNRCTFNDVPFPCCQDGAPGLTAALLGCYKLNISAAFAANPKMRDPNGRKELQVEAIVDMKYRYDYQIRDEATCLSFHYGDQMTTLFSAQNPIPEGSVVYTKLRATRHLYQANCINRYAFVESKHVGIHDELKEYFLNMTDPARYSVEKCIFARMIELMSIECGCIFQYDTINPNDSTICTPAHLYTCLYFALRSDEVKIRGNGGSTKDVLQELKAESSECLPLCDSWYYESQYTYQPLDDEIANSLDVLYNKMIITLDDEYVQMTDVYKVDTAAFLGLVGDAFGLFIGLSLVSLVHVVYWGTAALLLKRKLIKESRLKKLASVRSD